MLVPTVLPLVPRISTIGTSARDITVVSSLSTIGTDTAFNRFLGTKVSPREGISSPRSFGGTVLYSTNGVVSTSKSTV
ncbi:hypothetical protein ATCV1_z369L [Acanthocystis turfacea chlorella virus 1]|uniref:Uncharacterized protein z369L n=1 Tax=Chlorovirus heliozoae TaxID=322019 RepID=A7K8X9_9PHYC|nr:hypothetical protein ATCV1_z369L [Acanthocystis turfacea chlorella virus 1]ABT16503.1 hypothetical protein ATCV1_z369L [Acanthocystis turfacea chlorella virus 1]